ncbi:excinuclease ABC subunit UvrA [Capnocytophaga catalasegens]|uniref:UvrABC system protein A n=1 Tax=Capnocytophaga catalasegens TaxID=1004260 RepID=A0AAV5AVR1_9FLAO|nr:excinuclease ABC subunit UvrA [Capnocytophaga catalasegens]GIZ14100.1 UvrABC system protein A [Capnocytophaga catalasegens]GJM49098.1 UvrABC system protein A [Capnocytophaga catalasegens]GJM52359.1 UvrABC system protein A [Capnocytophaga catalasegens]
MKTKIDTTDNIIVKGAKLHNLKNIDVCIPRNQLVVITGLSGSGKSSLAFDTLYAEGQRRYVESLSSYARQFLGRLDKPQVDFIENIAPAIAIEQKVSTSNPRSTVGTSTEIYDYLKLLFARIGQTFSPISGKKVKKHNVSDVVDFVKTFPVASKLLLLAPISLAPERTYADTLRLLQEQGYVRIFYQEEVLRLDELDFEQVTTDFMLVVERIVVATDEDFAHRLADSVATAFFEGKGSCLIIALDSGERTEFSNKFELDGLTFLEPNVHLFSFNNPYGACPTCDGYGDTIGLDPSLIIPNTALSVYDNAIYPWRGETMSWFRDQLINNAYKFDFPIHKPWFELTEEQRKLIWTGNKYFVGLTDFFKELEEKNYKIQNRVLLARYRGKTRCTTCDGKRLRKEATYVRIADKSITDLVEMPVNQLYAFFEKLSLTTYQEQVSKRLLKEIRTRLQFLIDVGLGYLTLNRKSNTLSGGESQRINLATSLGSSLVGSMYILDEPSIGLHPKDTEKLIQVLKSLRDLGNTVIVVEHDAEIMKAADYIIDIGPQAGTLGGEVVAQGTYEQLLHADSLTGKYLSGKLRIEPPNKVRTSPHFIQITGAREHNLKNIDVVFPLDRLTVVTGVSGSGKSTLVKNILYPALLKQLGIAGEKAGQFTSISGKYNHIKQVEFVDQNPIGKSSRSNPVTYIKAYDDIRNLFASQKLAQLNNFSSKHFSFNVDGGRCEVCKGEGEVTIEMQFMADVHLPCEACGGKRFKKEVLDVKFHNKSIDDILNTTIDDAVAFFTEHKQTKIAQKLIPLQQVGLGYVTLGQSSSTLSGGEAQRIKLASFLVKSFSENHTLFIFDEPTTGLHFHDISKLLKSFNALIERGHSIIVIEHNMELIRCADYIIDLGLDGGKDGGTIVAEGTPTQVAQNTISYTARYL